MKTKKYFFREDEKEIKDSFVTDSKKTQKINLSDSSLSEKYEVWNIATVSDKLINGRIYPDNHVMDTVYEKKWTSPFAKPFLKNHDIYVTALGRTEKEFYINHDSLQIISNDEETIPEEVLTAFLNNDYLTKGTGSVILKIAATDDTVEQIKNGIFLTTSQASSTDGITCSICGRDYWDEKCKHVAGEEYDGVVAHYSTKALFPYENSVVNRPANDSSVLAIRDKETGEVFIFGKETVTPDMCKTKTKNEEEDSVEGNVEGKVVEDNVIDQNAAIKNNDNDNKGVEMDKKLKKMFDNCKKRSLRILSDTLSVEKETLQDAFDSFEDSESMALLELAEIIADKLTEQNKVKDETTKEQIKAKDEKISELENKIEDLEKELTDSKVNDNIEPEDEAKAEDEAEGEVDEEIQDTKDSKVDTKDTKDNKDSTKVPNFVDDVNVKKEKEKIEDENLDINVLKQIFGGK